MKNKAAIFLNGAYPPDHSYFYIHEYKRAGDDSVIIVADGGLQFFINHEIAPDLIIGDWDSADIETVKSYPKAVTISVPSEGKDYTDTELALNWCLENGVKDITLYGGVDNSFETDQMLGNVFLMFTYKDRFNSIKMRDYCQEIVPLIDECYTGNGTEDDMLSVVPVSEHIVLSGDGLKYDPSGKTYALGQTTSLRNQLADAVFHIELKGKGILIHHF